MSNLLFILFWIVSIVVGVLLIITKKKQYLVAYIIASAILYVTTIRLFNIAARALYNILQLRPAREHPHENQSLR